MSVENNSLEQDAIFKQGNDIIKRLVNIETEWKHILNNHVAIPKLNEYSEITRKLLEESIAFEGKTMNPENFGSSPELIHTLNTLREHVALSRKSLTSGLPISLLTGNTNTLFQSGLSNNLLRQSFHRSHYV